jgi:hypothetical protein
MNVAVAIHGLKPYLLWGKNLMAGPLFQIDLPVSPVQITGEELQVKFSGASV